MEKEWPEFVQKLLEHGLLYTRILGAGDDPSSPIGRGWQSTFMTKDRTEAEKRFVCHLMYQFTFLSCTYVLCFRRQAHDLCQLG